MSPPEVNDNDRETILESLSQYFLILILAVFIYLFIFFSLVIVFYFVFKSLPWTGVEN